MKAAYVTISYLVPFCPSEFGLSEDCTKQEFKAAIRNYLDQIFEEIQTDTGFNPRNVEVEFIS